MRGNSLVLLPVMAGIVSLGYFAAAGEALEITVPVQSYGTGSQLDVLISPDTATLLVLTKRGAFLHDAETLERRYALLPESGFLESGSFSPDGSSVAMAIWAWEYPAARGIGLWNTATGALVARLQEADETPRYVSFSPDGSRLLTTGDSTPPRLWNALTGALVARLQEADETSSDVSFSPDGNKCTCEARIFGEEVKVGLTGHEFSWTDSMASVVRSPERPK